MRARNKNTLECGAVVLVVAALRGCDIKSGRRNRPGGIRAKRVGLLTPNSRQF